MVVTQMHTFVKTCQTVHVRSEHLCYGNSTSIKLISLKNNENGPGRGACSGLHVFSLHCGCGSIEKCDYSQHVTGLLWEESDRGASVLWNGNPFNPELSLSAQVPPPIFSPRTSPVPPSEELPSTSSQLCSLDQPQAGVHLSSEGRGLRSV